MLRRDGISKKGKEDIETLMKFVGVLCRKNHDGEKTSFSFKLMAFKEID